MLSSEPLAWDQSSFDHYWIKYTFVLLSLNRLTNCFSSLEKTFNLLFFTRKDFYKITQFNMKERLEKDYNEYDSWFVLNEHFE
jgi:hypothetical protein